MKGIEPVFSYCNSCQLLIPHAEIHIGVSEEVFFSNQQAGLEALEQFLDERKIDRDQMLSLKTQIENSPLPLDHDALQKYIVSNPAVRAQWETESLRREIRFFAHDLGISLF